MSCTLPYLGAFHCFQKYQTLSKVYFPFCALYKMTQHLGTFIDSWALAGSAGTIITGVLVEAGTGWGAGTG